MPAYPTTTNTINVIPFVIPLSLTSPLPMFSGLLVIKPHDPTFHLHHKEQEILEHGDKLDLIDLSLCIRG